MTYRTGRNNPALDMYNMIGFCPSEILKREARFVFRNLVDASDKEVMGIQNELISFITQKVFKLSNRRAEGLVLHSGSEANEVAMLLAKKKTGKRLVVTSNLGHISIKRACEKLGMDILSLDVDTNTFRVNQAKLRQVLKKHIDKIALLNITYGTTNFGTGEDFEFNEEIAILCRESRVWVHVDAAYGGFIMNLSGYGDRAWQTSSLTYSITVDPHKFIGVLGCGVLLLANPQDKKLIGPEVTYFRGNTTALGTTRSAYPAAVALATMKQFGISGLKKLAKLCVMNAQLVGRRLEETGLSVVAPIRSGLVPIALNSERDIEYVRTGLLKRGFKVSPINISGGDYQILGIRIVVTPNPLRKLSNLIAFTKALIDIHKTV